VNAGRAELAPRLEGAIAARLGVRVHVAVDVAGSAALARALAAAGRPAEAPAWPCPYASLTHAGEVAIAIALSTDARAAGLGVDLELDRPVRPAMARLICSERERAWLDTIPEAQRGPELLRLWTIKEALYKADPAQGDSIVAQYEVASPGAEVTEGRRADDAVGAAVMSLRIDDATVSVALRGEQAP